MLCCHQFAQKTCPCPSQHYENLFLNMLYSCYVRCSFLPHSSFHLSELAKVWRCYVKQIVVLLGWVSFPITHPNPLAFVHSTLECCSFLMWAITVQPLFCTSLGLCRPPKKNTPHVARRDAMLATYSCLTANTPS